MKYDEIFEVIGNFGCYQKRVYFLVCLPAVLVGSFMLSLVIVMEPPKHRCKLPSLSNDTYAIVSHRQQELVNKYIPRSNDDGNKYDQCHIYTSSFNSSTDHKNTTKIKCSKWVYDLSTFKSTFTSQVNLVCDRSLFASLAETIFYFGVLVGDLLFGFLADRFGRSKSMYLGIVILIASSFGVCWAPDYTVFCVLQFIIGAACHGVFVVSYVIGMELVGPSKRNLAGILVGFAFSVGLLYLSCMAYLLKDWKYLAMSMAAPCVLFLPYYWLVPESPRWLISKGRHKQAAKILRKAASVNKVELDDEMIDSIEMNEKGKRGKLWHLFTSKVLLTRTLILLFNWMVVSLVYFGVTMNTGQLSGNFYLNFFLLAVVEFPSSVIGLVLIDRIGRKKTYSIFMFVAGFSCLSTLFTVVFGGKELQLLTSALAILGKLGSSVSFGAIYILSAELYPTVVRNTGMGASSCIARIGSMSAPYIAKVSDLVSGKIGQALPLVIFGAASLVAAVLSLLLPETLHQRLPETIADAENFGRNSTIQHLQTDINNEVDTLITANMDSDNDDEKPLLED